MAARIPAQRAQNPLRFDFGAVAQLGERLVRNEEVSGSIPLGSTSLRCSAASAGKPPGYEGCPPEATLAKAGFVFALPAALFFAAPRLRLAGPGRSRAMIRSPSPVRKCTHSHESDSSRPGLAAAPPVVRPVLDRAGLRQFRLPDGRRGDGLADVRADRLGARSRAGRAGAVPAGDGAVPGRRPARRPLRPPPHRAGLAAGRRLRRGGARLRRLHRHHQQGVDPGRRLLPRRRPRRRIAHDADAAAGRRADARCSRARWRPRRPRSRSPPSPGRRSAA